MNYYIKNIFTIFIVSISLIQGNPINAINDPRRHSSELIDSTDNSLKTINNNIDESNKNHDNLKVIMAATGIILAVATVIVVSFLISFEEMSFPKITDN